jgi:hypothetical protein
MSDQTADCPHMAPPGIEHELFKQFVGTWKGKVQIWMGPGDPVESTGTMVNEMDLDGRFLKQTYTGDANDGPFPNFAGRGFFGFNNTTGKFEGFWIDTASNQMATEFGDYDEATKTWTMLGEMNMGGGKTCGKRSVFTVLNENEQTLEMFFDMPGAGESKGMHIHYTRA